MANENPDKKYFLLKCTRSVIRELRENGQWGTAHVYNSTHNAFALFMEGEDVAFEDISPALLKRFEVYLRRRQCRWNTVATYMKVLKAVYNRATDNGMAPYIPHLFRNVRVRACMGCKKALEAVDMKLVLQDVGTGSGRTAPAMADKTKVCFALMFLLRGIPFVDLVFLRKSDICGNVLTYRRKKTGRQLVVTLLPEAQALMRMVSEGNDGSDYLFPFLQSPEGTENAYQEYQRALRKFNRRLAVWGDNLHLTLSTYTARHTWATMAYYCEVHPGVISEAMGHSSIAVTETYLKPFRNDRIDLANRKVVEFVLGEGRKRQGSCLKGRHRGLSVT